MMRPNIKQGCRLLFHESLPPFKLPLLVLSFCIRFLSVHVFVLMSPIEMLLGRQCFFMNKGGAAFAPLQLRAAAAPPPILKIINPYLLSPLFT